MRLLDSSPEDEALAHFCAAGDLVSQLAISPSVLLQSSNSATPLGYTSLCPGRLGCYRLGTAKFHSQMKNADQRSESHRIEALFRPRR